MKCEACVEADLKISDYNRPLNPSKQLDPYGYRIDFIEIEREKNCTCDDKEADCE